MATDKEEVYSVFKADKFAEAVAEGYTHLNKSTDKQWGVGGLGNEHVCEHCSVTLPDYAPQAVKDYFEANGHLDRKSARSLINVMASGKGLSDGWLSEEEERE